MSQTQLKKLLNYNKSSGFGGIIGDAIKGRTVKKSLENQDNVNFLKDAQSMFNNKGKYIGTDASETIEENALLYRELDDNVKEYVKDVAEGNIKLKEGQTLLQGYKAQGNILSKVGASLKNIGGQFLSTIVNGAVSMVASAVLTTAISGIKAYIESEERMAQKAQEITGKFKEQSTQITDYSKRIVELKTVLADEASSTEDVKNATSELYTIQNDLISQYGAYHDGIDLVNGDLETQLKTLREINRENAQRTINEINDTKTNKVKGLNFLAGLGESIVATTINPALGTGIYGTKFKQNYFDKNQGAKQALSNTFFESDLLGRDLGTEKYKSTTDQIKSMVNTYKGEITTANKQILQLARNYDKAFEVKGNRINFVGDIYEVEDAVTKLQLQLESLGITDEEVFNQLSQAASGTREVIQQVGDSYLSLIEAEVQTNGQLAKYKRDLDEVYNQYITAQTEGDTDKVAELAQRYKEVFSTIAESGIGDEYLSYFENLYPELSSIISQWKFEVEIIPKIKQHRGLEDFLGDNDANKLKSLYGYYNASGGAGGKTDPTTKGYWKTLEEAMTDSDFTDMGSYIDYLKSRPEYSDGMNAIKKAMGSNWKDEFEDEFAKLDLTAAVDIKPKPNGMEYTKEEIEKLLSPVSVEVEPKVDASAAVDSMADAKTAITSVNDLWEQTVQNTISLGKDKKYLDESGNVIKQQDTKNQAVGFADPEMINSVESAFYKFSDKLKAEGNDAAANKINQSLENFEKTLTEFPGDAEKAQGAIDDLITSYIDQTDIIKNLTEENAEWSIAQLEAYGIENAQAVVMSRLNKNAKELAEGYAKLRDQVEAYNAATQNGDTEEQAKSIGDITNQLNSMYGFTDHNGKEFKPFDDKFVSQNMDMINEAVNDTSGKFNELDRIAGKKYVADLIIDTDDTELQNAYGQVWNFLDAFDGESIDIGSSMDGTPIYATLEKIRQALNVSAQEWQEIVSSMTGGTITADVKYKEVQLALPTFSYADWKSAGGGVITPKNVGNYLKTSVQVPEMTYNYTGKGAKAHYGGAPSGGSGGSGGGGGGGGGGGNNNDKASKDKNKAQKNAAETFDWIEVYIKRIEEEIARLDKDATNVYKKWEDRNTSLAKEMAKVTEQIKAQKQAAEEYSRNANLVTGSGQLLTEKQNTAVKKAQKAWTSKLQQKIIDGDYTLTKKKKNGKTKTKLNTKKLEKDLGDAYNTYIKDAAQELFSLVKKNNKKNKKTKVQKNIIVGDNNKPKKSDYGDNTAQYKADLKDWKKAQEIWATGKYQEKILNGQITGKDIEQINNKYLVDAIKNTSEWVQKSIDENDEIQDLKIKLADLNKEELDNILKKWEQIVDVTQREVDDIDDMISRVETMGYWVSTDWLEKQNEKSATMVFKYDADLEEATTKFNEWVKKQEDEGKLYKDSEYYKEAVANLDDLTNKRNQELNKIEERNKKAREIIKEQFDYIEERLDGITKEAEALIEMASIEKTMDEYGNFNDRGMLKLAMVGAKFEEAERKLEDYTKRRQELEEQLLHDPMNKDLLAEVDEVRQGEYDMWKELASDYSEAASVFKESIDAHLNKLKEIIDDYKSALSAAKDLYEFQKNIGNQTKNIENLRKQLVAYQGDDSEAGRKRRQELTNQLNSAEQQLQETEWDRYINQTGEILDNLYNDYEETLNARLDNMEFLMGELITEVNNNAKSVVNGLTETMNTYGLQPSYFKDLLTKDKENAASVTENADANQKKILSGLHKDLYGDDSTLGKVTTSLKDYVKSMETAMDDDKLFTKVFGKFKELKVAEDGTLEVVDVTKDKVKVAKPIDNDRPLVHMYDIDEPNINNNKTNTTTAAQEAEQKKKAQEVENLQRQYDDYKAKITQEERKLNDERTKKKPNQEKINQYQKTINEYDALLRQIERELEKYGISTAVAGTLTNTNPFNKTFNNLNTNLLNGFAKGSKGISSTQLAWTNENWEKEGGELIFRKSDGAVLTPLNQGDMVFTADMTQRLWEIAQGMVPTSVGGQKLPNISSNNHSTVNTNNQITISLPNVNDYDSFKRELQNDSRFEKFIQEVTIGQAMGNNTLNKRKY